MTPPAVVDRKISSAFRASSAETRRASQARPRPSQSSKTERRVMPSSTPASGVTTRPSMTKKTLKPGPSVTFPSRSSRRQKSAPRSCASNWPRVRSAQWKFLAVGSTASAGMRSVSAMTRWGAALLHGGAHHPHPGDRESRDVVAPHGPDGRACRVPAARAGNPWPHRRFAGRSAPRTGAARPGCRRRSPWARSGTSAWRRGTARCGRRAGRSDPPRPPTTS